MAHEVSIDLFLEDTTWYYWLIIIDITLDYLAVIPIDLNVTGLVGG